MGEQRGQVRLVVFFLEAENSSRFCFEFTFLTIQSIFQLTITAKPKENRWLHTMQFKILSWFLFAFHKKPFMIKCCIFHGRSNLNKIITGQTEIFYRWLNSLSFFAFFRAEFFNSKSRKTHIYIIVWIPHWAFKRAFENFLFGYAFLFLLICFF